MADFSKKQKFYDTLSPTVRQSFEDMLHSAYSTYSSADMTEGDHFALIGYLYDWAKGVTGLDPDSARTGDYGQRQIAAEMAGKIDDKLFTQYVTKFQQSDTYKSLTSDYNKFTSAWKTYAPTKDQYDTIKWNDAALQKLYSEIHKSQPELNGTDIAQQVANRVLKDASETKYQPSGTTPTTTPTAEETMAKTRDIKSQLKGELETALNKYSATIPQDVAQYKALLQSQFEQGAKTLPRTMGEEFTAGVGLRSGAFQQSMAEELANRQAELANSLGQYQLQRNQEVNQTRLQNESNIANTTASTTENLGIQDYLNRLGFSQQMQALSQQNTYNQQSLASQQMFTGQQNAQNRQLQRDLYNQQLQTIRDQQNQAKKNASMTALTNLGLTGVGAGLGALFALPGMSVGAGALLGGGIASGNQGMTNAGLFAGYPQISEYGR